MKRSIIAALLGLALFSSGSNAIAMDDRLNSPTNFDIPAQSLGVSLKQLANQAGIQILFAEPTVDGLQAPAIKSRTTVLHALDALLEHTGVEYITKDGTVAIRKKAIANGPNRVAASGFLDKATADTSGAAGVVHADAVESASLEEVMITAERRSEDMQKTAASVSVRNGGDLLQQGRFSTRQILEDVAGLDLTDSTGMLTSGSDAAGSNVTIRGVRSNDVLSNLPGVAATAMYTDGVYEGVGGSYDLDRVEVLRGPQGTLYGRSATAGVVAFHTRNPTFDKVGGDAAVEFGNYSLQHYTGAVNVPVTSTLALRVSGNKYQRDGYDAAPGGTHQGRDADNTAGRIKLLYKPVASLSVLLGAALDNYRTHEGGAESILVASDTFEYRPIELQPVSKSDFRQYWAELNWDLGPATLTYLPAYRSWDQDAHRFVGTSPFLGTITQRLQTPFDQFITHELRLTSNSGSKLTWIAGAFYFDNRLRNSNLVQTTVLGTVVDQRASRKTSDEGIFGELTYPLTDALRVTLGARYDDTEVKTDEVYSAPPAPPITLGGPDGTRRFYNPTYKLRLEDDLTLSNLLYAMVSTGFLPGDVQVINGTTGSVVQNYATETLTAYEIGSKNRFLDESLQINGSAYYYDYGAFQTPVSPYPNDPGSSFIASIPARIWGGEFELIYQLTARDRLSVSYAYTNARYVGPLAHTADLGGYCPQGCVSQTQVQSVTPHTVTAGYDHVFSLAGDSTLVLHADARLLSAHDVYLATDNIVGIEPYAHLDTKVIGNLNVAWHSSGGTYSVTGYVRNVSNTRYATMISSVATTATPPYTVTQVNANQSDPRTYGVVISAHF